MSQQMRWKQACSMFPNQWVAFAHYRRLSDGPLGDIEGEVVVHDANEKHFVDQIKNLPEHFGDLDIRFTGELLPDYPIGPILWRI